MQHMGIPLHSRDSERADPETEDRVHDQEYDEGGNPGHSPDDCGLGPATGIPPVDDADPDDQRNDWTDQWDPRGECPSDGAEKGGNDSVAVVSDVHDDPGTDVNGKATD